MVVNATLSELEIDSMLSESVSKAKSHIYSSNFVDSRCSGLSEVNVFGVSNECFILLSLPNDLFSSVYFGAVLLSVL